jgi:hypothetical protein
MGWGIEIKSVRLFLPTFTDELVDGETSESLEPFGEVVGDNEVNEVHLLLVVAVVVVTLNGIFFDRSVHALDLPVGPRMVGCCRAMFDATAKAEPIKGWPRQRAVGPFRFLGRSANWMPLSVRTVWIRLGTAATNASRKAAAARMSACSTNSTKVNSRCGR